MTTITSLQNPRVKNTVRLRQGRHREKQGRILIDGARELALAMEAGVELVEVFVCEPLLKSAESQRVVAGLPGTAAEVSYVSELVLGKLAFGDRAEGVLGVAITPARGLVDLVLPENPLVAVFEGVEKPGNLGAVVRSADAAGLDAVIVADGRTDPFNPNAIRASLGTLFTMPLASVSSEEALEWLLGRGLSIFAARVEASVAYTEADYRDGAAIVVGSEARGLTDAWARDGVTAVRLPMRGSADSLNVSATAAVLFYEALRQRGHGPLG
jgi:TrmH family RNA methyltransferase